MYITNAQIAGRLKLLADEHLKADSGTDVQVVSDSIKNGTNYLNHFICFISGNNMYEDRVVTSYDVSTGTFGFDQLLLPVLDTDEFCLTAKGFQSDVAQAESFIRNDFRNRGYDLDLFLTEPQLEEAYIYKTIELICSGLMNDGVDTDVYYMHSERYKTLYEQNMSNLIADYDANEDGTIDDVEELNKLGQIKFIR